MTDYKARVPDFAEREEASRLYNAYHAADKAHWSAPNRVLTPEQHAAVDKLSLEFSRKMQDLEDWYCAEYERAVGPDPHAHLAAARDAASDAYDAHPGSAVREDDDGNPARCALSGAVPYDTDDVIEIGDKLVLMSLFVPADVIADLKPVDDEDDEAEVEIAEAAE